MRIEWKTSQKGSWAGAGVLAFGTVVILRGFDMLKESCWGFISTKRPEEWPDLGQGVIVAVGKNGVWVRNFWERG